MIIAKVSHGLGNQLFQYAAARHLSIIKNTSLCFDARYYHHDYATDTPRQFKLDNFNIKYKLLEQSQLLVYLSKSTKLIPNRTFVPFFQLKSEKNNQFDASVLKANSLFIYLKGYWQSEKYFAASANIIRKELSFSFLQHDKTNHYRELIAAANNPVSLHIRRGDYVNNPGFNNQYGFIGLEYYYKAIATLKEKTGNCDFFVFSDDLNWVAENLDIGSNYIFVDNNNADGDMADLHLMSLCKHNIIANSSFSWWGAWLNNNQNKICTSPKEWYKNKPGFVMDDLIPDTWIKI